MKNRTGYGCFVKCAFLCLFTGCAQVRTGGRFNSTSLAVRISSWPEGKPLGGVKTAITYRIRGLADILNPIGRFYHPDTRWEHQRTDSQGVVHFDVRPGDELVVYPDVSGVRIAAGKDVFTFNRRLRENADDPNFISLRVEMHGRVSNKPDFSINWRQITTIP